VAVQALDLRALTYKVVPVVLVVVPQELAACLVVPPTLSQVRATVVGKVVTLAVILLAVVVVALLQRALLPIQVQAVMVLQMQ
jgi:hypothetical protein